MIIFFSIAVICVLGLLANFFGFELLKKFKFMGVFVENSNQMIKLFYPASKFRKRGMQNIVLRGTKPFCALVGFRLNIPIIEYTGYDYYGFVRSDKDGIAVVSTFLGKGSCEFLFFVNTDLTVNPITVTADESDQGLHPNAIYPPHWYQRLGFYS